MQSKHIAILVAVYIAVSAVSFGGFTLARGNGAGGSALSGLTGGSLIENLIQPVVPKSKGGLAIDQNLPKTEECPLNGEKFTVPEREAWMKRRPLFVMIENHVDARPQSGLGSADIVYEAIAEGGITRFMAGYYCSAQAKDTIVAPVRSARQYFIDFASDYNFPLYAHVGGANGEDTDSRVRALEHLTDYKWTNANDLNQFSIGYPVFVRNYDRVPGKTDIATEHTMESSTNRLWDYASAKRGITNLDKAGKDWMAGFTKWSFADEADAGKRGTTKSIAHEFWEGQSQFAVQWNYDSATNVYLRDMAGEKHLDMNDQKQIGVKNVVILFTKEEGPVDIHKHMYYKTSGTGKAMVYQNGQQIEAVWSKKDRISRLTFNDKKGQPIKFVRGKIWISIVADGTAVTTQ